MTIGFNLGYFITLHNIDVKTTTMAKSAKNKSKKGVTHQKKGIPKKSKSKRNWWQIVIVIAVIIAFILLAILPNFNNSSKQNTARRTEIKFTKEGELSFYKKNKNKEMKSIDIEISENDQERMIGLMFRYQMNENNGMIFIMDREELQSFWMKNTYVSLDIIYLNKDLEIVTIQKYTQPLTEDPIPSYKKAKYVLEVVAGFCDTYKIEEGDYVKYERIYIAPSS